MCDNHGPSLERVLENLRQPMPFGRKVRLVIGNTLRKMIRLRSCCGRPGQPGC